MRRCVCLLAMLAALVMGAAPVHAAPNYTGLWWNPSESGWGINLSHQDDLIAASWWTYDSSGDASWFYMTATQSGNAFSGTIFRANGSAYNAPHNTSATVITQAGTGTILFTGTASATFAYTVDGIAGTKTLQPQVFNVGVPTCLWDQHPNPALSTNYQGLWWNLSELWWMLNVAHQGDRIFATLFVHDLDGSPLWLVMANGERTGNAYSGPLYRMTGPAFNANPWNPAQVNVAQVGAMTITFTDGNAATLAYSVNGSNMSKSLTRQVNRGTGTICGFAPGTPAAPTATGGPAQATVSFAAPASDGGFPITSYTVRASPGGASATGSSSPITVTNLTPGAGYMFTVTASNAVGDSVTSPPSANAVPTNVPTTRPNDFNADGHPDLIWSNTANGATYLWYMNGPTLGVDAFITQVDPSWKIQGVADFNGDGHPDLVWRNTATGSTFVWYMNFSSFVSDAPLFTLPPEWVIQGVADFNGDGKPDFLLRNTVSGNAFVWFFNDATPIGDQFLFTIDPLWKVEAVADLDHDGHPDLMFRNMRSGLAFVWNTEFGGGTLSLGTSTSPIFGIDPVWEIVQWEDWNGDGDHDLVFRNRDTGLVFVWYLVATRLGGSDFITQIDPGWEIVPRR